MAWWLAAQERCKLKVARRSTQDATTRLVWFELLCRSVGAFFLVVDMDGWDPAPAFHYMYIDINYMGVAGLDTKLQAVNIPFYRKYTLPLLYTTSWESQKQM